MELINWDTGCEQQSVQSWFDKGEAALCQNRHSEATTCFGQAIKDDPFNAKAHRGLSDAYWAQGKTEDALNSLTRALELEPGDRDTVLSCTRIFTALGKDDFAEEVIQSYLEKNPHDAEFRSLLESTAVPTDRPRSRETAEFFKQQGEIQFGRGNIAHAMACFEMAIEEDPLMAEAYNNLGVVKLESGNITEALQNFYKALELKPEDPEILGNSAKGLARGAHIDTAIEVYREYLRRAPEDSKGWLEFESLIRQSAASGWSPEGLSHEVADIYARTAEMLKNAGDLQGAAEAVGRALRIKPAAPESLYVLASLHSAIGQKDEAEGILDHALKIDPAHGPCSEMRESIRNGNGRKSHRHNS